MKEIVDFAKKHQVKTIFFEELVSPKISETIAKEIGAQTKSYFRAMSYAKVFCNGKAVTEWPYGYASFRADLTPFVKEGKKRLSA